MATEAKDRVLRELPGATARRDPKYGDWGIYHAYELAGYGTTEDDAWRDAWAVSQANTSRARSQ